MWLLTNKTPFAAERTWVRDESGAEVWLVAVKASFVIGPDGKQRLDDEQTEVHRVPEFRGDPASTSLLHEADLIHKKVRTDVVLEGSAFAPGGRAAESVEVRLKVANIDKRLRVWGDRVIQPGVVGVKLSRPEPFTVMPITYERAFGGTDLKDADPKRHAWEARNPVGAGFATRGEHIAGTPAPNVERPNRPYTDPGRGEPAGFGPVARHWVPRVKLAGTYDDRWERDRSPLLPADFDPKFYQCAPEDQQTEDFLQGGEEVELTNLTPDGRLDFRLPRVALRLSTRFLDGTRVEHRADLHTLALEPSRRRFQMVWHSHLECHHKVNKLQGTRVVLKPRVNAPNTGAWTGG